LRSAAISTWSISAKQNGYGTYVPYSTYLGAALAYVKKAMFRGFGVESFAKIFNFEDED